MIPHNYTGPATWRTKDVDQPIEITGCMGQQNGQTYFSIADSATGIPENEIVLPINLTDIPAIKTLCDIPNWVGGKLPDKIPLNPHTGGNAQSTNSKTWGNYGQALEAKKRFGWDLIGFACHPETINLVFIDLDHCVENGQIQPWAMEIIQAINSYSETSPSREGIHILARGYLPDNIPALRTKENDIDLVGPPPSIPELYHRERWFTITGNHIPRTPETIEDRPGEVIALYGKTRLLFDSYKAQLERTKIRLNSARKSHAQGGQGDDYARMKTEILAAYNFDTLINFALSLYPGKTEPADKGATRILGHGGLIIYPTDPPHWKNYSDGIGGDAFNLAALHLWGNHKTDGRDFHEAMKLAGNFVGIDVDERLKESRPTAGQVKTLAAPGEESPSTDTRPWVQINARHHREISEDVYNALLTSNNPPRVFIRSGLLTRIKLDEKNRPIAEDISPEVLKYDLDRAANCFSRRKTEDGFIDTKTSVQMAVVKDVMAYPHWPELPPLAGIVQYPTFLPDGSLHAEPGYDSVNQIFYYPNGLKIGDITPTVENVKWAKDIIYNNLLVDFPFVDNASKTHAIAALLLPYIRFSIDGETPLHIFDAPTPGTGKGKLVRTASLPTAPNGAALITPPDNDEEWRKTIVSTLLQTPSHVLIDNIPEKLESGTLAAVLTTRDYTARLLGTMKNITVQNLAVWMGTGNNTSAHGELARRIVWSRIDARMEKPWERENFKHKDLEKWIKQNRGDIVTACLILIKLWFVAGCPLGDKPMGSFENWAAIMGGILQVIDKDCDFLGNADSMYDRTNKDRAPWLMFVEQWHEAYQTNQVGIAELFPIASYYDTRESNPAPEGMNLLGEFIESNNEHARQIRLGILLKTKADNVFGKYRIVSAGDKKRLAQYKLALV